MVLEKKLNISSLGERPELKAFALKTKDIVHAYDPLAELVLFGSSARGDCEPESDWDLLVLTKNENTDLLQKLLIKDFLYKIEIPNDLAISLLLKNEADWEENYIVTPLYDSIRKEGIIL